MYCTCTLVSLSIKNKNIRTLTFVSLLCMAYSCWGYPANINMRTYERLTVTPSSPVTVDFNYRLCTHICFTLTAILC